MLPFFEKNLVFSNNQNPTIIGAGEESCFAKKILSELPLMSQETDLNRLTKQTALSSIAFFCCITVSAIVPIAIIQVAQNVYRTTNVRFIR